MNHHFLAGHLGADPEVRFTPSGQKVTTIRVACNQRRGGQDETIWYRVTVWGEQYDKMMTYFKKGSSIMVAGELAKPEIYTDKSGNPQVSLNVTAHQLYFSPFGRGDRSNQDGMGQAQQSNVAPSSFADEASQGAAIPGGNANAPSFADEEIPF